MYKVVIIEDDPLSQEALKDLFQGHFRNYSINGIFSSIKESVRELSDMDVDLVILDMELTDGKGFDVLQQLEKIDFDVIIATMHDRFMLEAIKHSAIDYLLKPILKEELASALKRFENKVQKLEKIKSESTQERSTRLVIPNQDGLELVEIKDLLRLESDGSYTKLFLLGGKHLLTSKNLGYYEDKLKAHHFFRVHHQHLISLNHVKNYMKGEGGSVTMSDNAVIDVSRRRKEEFLNRLAF